MNDQNFLNNFLEEMDNPNPFTESEPQTETSPVTVQEESKPIQEAESIPANFPKENAPVQPKVETAETPSTIAEESESEPEQDEQEENPDEQTDSPEKDEPQVSLLSDDPFEAAIQKSAEQSKARLIGTLAAKNPVFKYGNVSEPITDKDLTFDDLRKKYENDFPEFEESKKISWTVTYGKISETVVSPTKIKIFTFKASIEKSDKFIAELKKAKKDEDKNPDCIVKPTVTAQKKGDASALPAAEALMPSYKGFFVDYDEAIKSGKAICFVPAKDGQIYEVRKNKIGIFQSPAKAIGEFPEISTKFVMSLPKIPMFLLYQVISFFRAISRKAKLEVLVHLVYDTEIQKYNVIVPTQKVTNVSVDSKTEEYPDHIIHVMDIHSHNVMSAKFSSIDDNDEKVTRLYGVVGRLDKAMPDISLRASNAGKFIELNSEEIFDFESTYPEEWFDNLDHAMAEAICESEQNSEYGKVYETRKTA